MSKATRYRQFTAAILLAVYAFIATPVQLWHHHPVSNNAKQFDKSGYSILSQNKGSISDVNCPICHHQYSVYNNDTVIPVIPLITEFSLKNGHYSVAFLSHLCYSSQNKGPPFLS